MPRPDPHSYTDDTQLETASLELTARVDFGAHVLDAAVVLTFRKPGSGVVDLDTRDLAILAVSDDAGQPLDFHLHPADPVLGTRLSIIMPRVTTSIRIRYRTAPHASALQWLEPAQTMGGKLPFLFSQCQAIHARSVMPLQDTPRLRITYRATLAIPRALTAVMGAAHLGREAGAALPDDLTGQGPADELALERFAMPQPIPPYLFAFAVGELVAKDLSPRSRVWAEPGMLERAAFEFAGVEQMMSAAETLFGPYDWERFDLLTMPPSFPYGGMENPRLTFVTPTVIAGDRSLVRLIAHELAHSWTGNLVTNANAEHFWLNEGFTVYAERRILQSVHGDDTAALAAALGRRNLEQALTRFADRPSLTRLRTQLTGIDPDEAFSLIPYEKGYDLLVTLEAAVGRARFDQWLRSYLATFRFQAITTDDFLAHFEQALPGILAKVGAERWIDGEGVPARANAAKSHQLAEVLDVGGSCPSQARARDWTATQWQLYLESVPRPATTELCETLERRFGLSASTNYEILVAWLTLALESGHHDVLPAVERVLATVGRMKFLRPLYLALSKDPRTRSLAETWFERHRASYHPIARQVVQAALRAAAA